MFFGSFCWKREVSKVVDRLYRVLRIVHTFTKAGAKHLVDLYSGTTCLAEAVLRAGIVKDSTGTWTNVKLIDVKPWPRLVEIRGLRRLSRPVLPKGLTIEIRAEDPSLRELANALNDIIKIKQKQGQNIIYSPFKLSSPVRSMEPVIVRLGLQEGWINFILEAAEKWLPRVLRSEAKRLYRTGTVRVIDPPWRGVPVEEYYGSKFNREKQFVTVIGELYRHEAGPVIYVDSEEGIREVLRRWDRMVIGYYRLYGRKKPAMIVALMPRLAEGLEIREEKEELALDLLNNKIRREYEARRKSGKTVLEFFGLQDRRKPFAKRIYEALPERDRMKEPLSRVIRKKDLTDFLGDLI